MYPCEPASPKAAASPRNWAHRVRPEHVHGSVYPDPAIFELEEARIWRRTWVYVGHTSEVPNANDFVMKSIGPEPIIMTRDSQGQVHLLHNRCSHRGNRACMAEKGRARSFSCPYHGWNLGKDGSLRDIPFPSAYEGVDRARLGLGQVARVSIYKGFVFGSMAAVGPSLEQHLGAAKGAIDALCLNSREGEVEFTAGIFLADDAEMHERTQLGVQASHPEWSFLGRGNHRERTDDKGFLIGDATDETPSRGIWRDDRSLMEAG